MGEHVDVVDANDTITGNAVELSVAHRDYLPHRIAAVLVFKPSGKLIVQIHESGGRLDHSVGGHVSAGESYEVAAKREMKEELGIVVPISKIAEGVISEEHYKKEDKKLFHIFGIFTAEVPEDWKLKPTKEVKEVLEMQVDEILVGMRQKPDEFLQGFMTTLTTYLKASGSKKGEL